MSITTVLFDLGGVVCRFMPERRLAALAAASPLSAADIQAQIWASGLDARTDSGLLDAAQLYAEVGLRTRLTLSYAEFQAVWMLAFEPDPLVLALVDAVAKHARVALLTNNCAVLRDALPRCLPQVSSRFTEALLSCNLGALKPNSEACSRALARLDVTAADALMIDDASANARAAEQATLPGILFLGPRQLRRNLARVRDTLKQRRVRNNAPRGAQRQEAAHGPTPPNRSAVIRGT